MALSAGAAEAHARGGAPENFGRRQAHAPAIVFERERCHHDAVDVAAGTVRADEALASGDVIKVVRFWTQADRTCLPIDLKTESVCDGEENLTGQRPALKCG